MSKASSPEKMFEGISRFIDDSRNLLKEGAVMELSGLDEQVRGLCEQMLELSQDDRIMYADKLQKLLGELKKLGEELVVHRDAMVKEIQHISEHRKANVAYRTADASDDFGKKKEEE